MLGVFFIDGVNVRYGRKRCLLFWDFPCTICWMLCLNVFKLKLKCYLNLNLSIISICTIVEEL